MYTFITASIRIKEQALDMLQEFGSPEISCSTTQACTHLYQCRCSLFIPVHTDIKLFGLPVLFPLEAFSCLWLITCHLQFVLFFFDLGKSELSLLNHCWNEVNLPTFVMRVQDHRNDEVSDLAHLNSDLPYTHIVDLIIWYIYSSVFPS